MRLVIKPARFALFHLGCQPHVLLVEGAYKIPQMGKDRTANKLTPGASNGRYATIVSLPLLFRRNSSFLAKKGKARGPSAPKQVAGRRTPKLTIAATAATSRRKRIAYIATRRGNLRRPPVTRPLNSKYHIQIQGPRIPIRLAHQICGRIHSAVGRRVWRFRHFGFRYRKRQSNLNTGRPGHNTTARLRRCRVFGDPCHPNVR